MSITPALARAALELYQTVARKREVPVGLADDAVEHLIVLATMLLEQAYTRTDQRQEGMMVPIKALWQVIRDNEEPDAKPDSSLELDVLDALLAVRHRRLSDRQEDSEAQKQLDQLHKAAQLYTAMINEDHELYDARDLLNASSEIPTTQLIPKRTQPIALRALTRFVSDLYDACQRIEEPSLDLAKLYAGKIADAACMLGFGLAPLAHRYEGAELDEASKRLLAPNKRNKDVPALVRYGLRMRGLTIKDADNLTATLSVE